MKSLKRKRLLPRLFFATAIFASIIFASIIFAATPGRIAAQPSPAFEIWFEDLAGPLTLEGEEGAAVVRAAYKTLTAGITTLAAFPDPWQRDVAPRVVFLSATSGRRRAQVVTGAGRGLRRALEDAVRRLLRAGVNAKEIQWLKIDFVKAVGSTVGILPGAPIAIRRGLEGIAFDRSLGFAVLPEEVVSYRMLDARGRVMRDGVERVTAARGAALDAKILKRVMRPLKARTFRTEGFFFDGKQVVRLFRGHRIREKITAPILFQAAESAGDYLERSVSARGKFAYSYLPWTDQLADKYNLVRHAGTVYSMLELYEVTRDPELLRAADRAVTYLLNYVEPFGSEAEAMSILVSTNKIKLGGVALTAVALAKYIEVADDKKLLPRVQRLARYIQDAQGKNGRFVSQRHYPSGRARVNFESGYYPGEALLALVRLYALDRQEAWLDTAEKGAHYLITIRDRGVPTLKLLHDHWLLYALNELHRFRPKELYLNHAMRIVQAITAGQNRKPAYPDYLGSYYNPPRSTPTATRTEGLLAAYKLATDFGKTREAPRILEAIRLGIGFQLQTQFRAEKTMYFGDPRKPLGGFSRSFADLEIRIDYVQHNISAILGLYALMRKVNGAGPGRGAR